MSFTWNISPAADAVIGANVADDLLAALNTHLTANPPLYWEIATYQSVSPRYLLLRPRGSGAGRIIFFGQQGSTPNAAAVRAATASLLYVGFSASSTSDTADGSWLTGAPLSAADYIPGIACQPSTASVTWRINYAESSEIFLFMPSQSANGYAVSGAGYLVEGLDGTLYPSIVGTGTNWAASWSSALTGTGSIINGTPATDASYATSQSALVARISGANRLLFKGVVVSASTPPIFSDTSTLRQYFLPVPIVGNTSGTPWGIVGKLRQMAIGPSCLRETSWLDSATGTLRAYGHAYQTGTTNPGFWLLNADI